MGNCDTHVFLGSNSFKTVEYFSKALGEKTITRDSRSINRDKQYRKQGYSDSDQVMARALMTPDELRRMDNDLCIIYEKGLKPIKAKKLYYFETPMVKKLNEVRLNHLEFDVGDRGKWRKYNPYNPYTEDTDTEGTDLKVESLDDLFDDLPEAEEKEQIQEEQKPTEFVKLEETPVKDEAPILPQENSDDDIFSEDIQKQLEAKFDELFGPVEDDNK